jgi:hypothetical protein
VADQVSQEIEVELPPELEVGVYANFALVGHGEHDFVLDLCQINPPREEGGPPRARVVSRIRFAPTFVGPLLQAISQNAFRRDEALREATQGGTAGDEGGDPE